MEPLSRVTYIDTDPRAARFFADDALVQADLEGHTPSPGGARAPASSRRTMPRCCHSPDAGFALLISLYADPVWDHCRRHLADGGLFLANTSHGDASLAALDPALTRVAAVHSRRGSYRLVTDRLDRYLIPRSPARADAQTIRQTERGVGYTVTAFAYIFRFTQPPDAAVLPRGDAEERA